MPTKYSVVSAINFNAYIERKAINLFKSVIWHAKAIHQFYGIIAQNGITQFVHNVGEFFKNVIDMNYIVYIDKYVTLHF